jgi:hypothetical protein
MTNVEQVKIPEGYKQAEVGGIPEDWIPLKLSDIAELTSSKRIFEGDYVQNGIPFYRGQEISQLLNREKLIVKCYISEGKYNFLKNRFGAPQRGDILITAVGTLGNAFLIDTDSPFYIKDGNLIWLRKVKPTVIGPYLIKQLEWHKDKIIEGAIGSSQKALTIVVLKKLEVPIPSIKEQTAIANALSDVDNLIASLETLIAKKSAIKTAAMQQLLTGKKRLPGFEGKCVKESEKQDAKQNSELDNTSEAAQAAQTKQAFTLNSDLYKESGEGLDEKSNQHSEVGNANNKQTAPRPGYKQTELGEIPEDWECIDLSEVFSFRQGMQVPVEKQFLSQGEGLVRFIRIIDLTSSDEPPRYISEPGRKYHINSADLFMVRYGAPGLIGYQYKGVIANNLFKIIPKIEICNSFYFQ